MNQTLARCHAFALGVLAVTVTLVPPAFAQPPAAPPAAPAAARQPVPQVVSPEVLADRRITFRVSAPKAEIVRLNAGDIPGTGMGVSMTRGEGGVFEATVGPVEPGAYRYTFNIDGVSVMDPRNPAVSESNNNAWSLVVVPGSDLMDTRNVPHGAVAAVTYYSSALGTFRRMHVYTPPGYERGSARYPVFYLLHGAGDCDDSWTSVGRAGFILDNLIAAGKARPMVVVMPAGHVRRGSSPAPAPGAPGAAAAPDEFARDFTTDVMPYVETHYRVLVDRASRAIAGLSMGGNQSLQVAVPNLSRFGYIGVFSSGLISAFARQRPPVEGAAPDPTALAPGQMTPAGTAWEKQHLAVLDDAALKKGLKLFWFGTGKDDFLLVTTQRTVELFKKHGFAVEYDETPGAHTWLNWRAYLIGFAPRLFR